MSDGAGEEKGWKSVRGFSDAFILRPVGTTLMAIGLFLVGMVAYMVLPVASLPSVDFPTIRVFASRPGADPATMAASVAAPLERRLGSIPGVTEITSSSSLGSTSIVLQFDLTRNTDSAARDVQAALNAAATDLPGDLPTLPQFRKANPNAAPILILALTSETMTPSAMYDAADTVIAQRIAQVEGVGDVSVAGAEQPAIRVRVDPARLAAMGLSLDAVRTAIVNANTVSAVGSFDGGRLSETLSVNNQIREPQDYGNIVVRAAKGTVVRLADVATVERGVRNSRAAGWYNGKPAILITITKQADANVIDTVDRVKALLPEIQAWVPAGIRFSIMSDRTVTIRASIADIQHTLMISIGLVMLVVFLFLRRTTLTVAAGVTVPLSIAGTFAAMWVAGFTLDNLSLMAVTISVGFVVDDAIVMIENIERNIARGLSPLSAALVGAGQIGFTVISISLSLIAAFIPLFFMDGVVGRFFREFTLTLTFAILVSTVVSLSVTPMVCAHFLKSGPHRPGRFDRAVERVLTAMTGFYARTLTVVLRHSWLMLVVMIATVALSVQMFRSAPKGYFPQDDTGLIVGFTQASPDISFPAMAQLQQQGAAIVAADPAVFGVASSIGGGSGSVNTGRFFVSLKPLEERGASSAQVVARLRGRLGSIPGLRIFLTPVQDVRAGGRQGRSQYQFTLWDPNLPELEEWVPKVVERLRALPELVDVSTDREQGGLQADVVIDRNKASQLGVAIQAIDNALADAFSQRQISTIYGARNQYRVVLEVEPSRSRDPGDILDLHVPGRNGAQVPLRSLVKVERGTAPLVINHQGPFPAVTITYDLAPGVGLQEASEAVVAAVEGLHMPASLRAEFAGDAKAFAQGAGSQGMMILVAILAVYIILGVLYESLIHPVTILSTLPSAGLGALIALRFAGADLTIIAFIGIILLIGIVKKNGIMMVDFAIVAERRQAFAPREAIFEACLKRFRPILMTTLSAMLGAVPLMLATGPGAELRRPLGITIVGGLILSQILTLYTTPVIYLWMSRLGAARKRGAGDSGGHGQGLGPQPAE
ncbi:efflux RND transporter permease subunit [Bosea sp. (in: a-proteobacteria)]|uniref:efflux RND transporter permease subunit n=1 Tax=Bosea sp. (in: a-proteobacteria) TaxID=1871050 RepID=UPI0026293DBE|nr:efflux RND transporter permease subunit [Bosea sp. (in: a-proteobacteria)]MCO5091837.1 efflux RND transporter permease subunit [Bosea sp. (in: a-proteobacteria)]